MQAGPARKWYSCPPVPTGCGRLHLAVLTAVMLQGMTTLGGACLGLIKCCQGRRVDQAQGRHCCTGPLLLHAGSRHQDSGAGGVEP
jgi:hypothetical protein